MLLEDSLWTKFMVTQGQNCNFLWIKFMVTLQGSTKSEKVVGLPNRPQSMKNMQFLML